MIAILHCFWSGVWFELCMLILNVRIINIDWSMLYWVSSAFIKNIMNKFMVIIKFIFKVFLFILLMCMCLCGYMSYKGMRKHQKRTTDPPELEGQTTVSLHASAGDYWPISPAPYAILIKWQNLNRKNEAIAYNVNKQCLLSLCCPFL